MRSSRPFRWLNEAQTRIVTVYPQALATRVSHTLSHGINQSYGNSYFRLLDVVYNLTGSADRGSAITRVDEARLTAEDPDWPTHTAQSGAIHWMASSKDEMAGRFQVYPPQPDGGGGIVELLVCPHPTAATSASSALDFESEYQQGLVDYIVYRAFSEDRANESSAAMAQKHFQLFSDCLKTVMGEG